MCSGGTPPPQLAPNLLPPSNWHPKLCDAWESFLLSLSRHVMALEQEVRCQANRSEGVLSLHSDDQITTRNRAFGHALGLHPQKI